MKISYNVKFRLIQVGIIAFIFLVILMLSLSLNNVVEEIESKGLKNITHEIWEGKKAN